jgi:uncharacterized membrane protein YccC
VPDLPIDVHYDDSQDSGREQLLALHQLRRNLEQLAARFPAIRRTAVAVNDNELVRTLEELIAALDRRIPHLEREGEATIVRDAALLREKALGRLAELTGDPDKQRALRPRD